MTILAIEFSSGQRSVAIVAGGEVRGRAAETGGRTARAFTLIERALAEARLEREQIECLAIGLGPGSYAGIRAAIALAQGWQIARPVRLLGVSSVECLAAQAQAANLFGRVNLLLDAQRGDFYFAAYEIDAGGCRVTVPLHLATADVAVTRTTDGILLVEPHLLPRFPHGRVMNPDAAMLGQLAMNRTGFVAGDQLEPIYLRETEFVKAPPPRIIPLL
jgi:tRNA threonylcarbamoyl adenosine modification protein YeaZ